MRRDGSCSSDGSRQEWWIDFRRNVNHSRYDVELKVRMPSFGQQWKMIPPFLQQRIWEESKKEISSAQMALGEASSRRAGERRHSCGGGADGGGDGGRGGVGVVDEA